MRGNFRHKERYSVWHTLAARRKMQRKRIRLLVKRPIQRESQTRWIASERESACTADRLNAEKNEEYEEGAEARAKPEGTGKHIE